MILPDHLPEGHYNLTVPVIGRSAETQPAFAQALAEAFHLKVHMEERERVVAVMSLPTNKLPAGLTPAPPNATYGGNRTTGPGDQFSACNMDDLRKWMEETMTNTPVINETHLTGRFDFLINSDVLFDVLSVPKHVGELGLEVTLESRRIPMLVVEREPQPGDPGASSLTTLPVGVELCKSPGYSCVRANVHPRTPLPFNLHEDVNDVAASSARDILLTIWEISPGSLEVHSPLPQGFFDMMIPAGDTPDKSRAAFAQAFGEAFHLKVRMVEKEKPVLVVSLPGSNPPAALTASPKGTYPERVRTPTTLEFHANNMDQLCQWMEANVTDTPVFNETGLSGRFNFMLNSEVRTNPNSIPQHVRELGLDVQPQTRRIPILVVDHD